MFLFNFKMRKARGPFWSTRLSNNQQFYCIACNMHINTESQTIIYVPVSIYRYLGWQDYHIGTARKMSVDIDATPQMLLLIQQKLCIVPYRYNSLSPWTTVKVCVYGQTGE